MARLGGGLTSPRGLVGVQATKADPNKWQEPRLASPGTVGKMHWEQEVLGASLRSVDSLIQICIVFSFSHR